MSDNDVNVDINSLVKTKFYYGQQHKFVAQAIQKDVTIAKGDTISFNIPVEFEKYHDAKVSLKLDLKVHRGINYIF